MVDLEALPLRPGGESVLMMIGPLFCRVNLLTAPTHSVNVEVCCTVRGRRVTLKMLHVSARVTLARGRCVTSYVLTRARAINDTILTLSLLVLSRTCHNSTSQVEVARQRLQDRGCQAR